MIDNLIIKFNVHLVVKVDPHFNICYAFSFLDRTVEHHKANHTNTKFEN